jgi:hypothetical protein
MKEKLTLSIEKSIISRAKKYSRFNRKSISEIVENHLEDLTDKKVTVRSGRKIHPRVKKLAGVLKRQGNKDVKKEYHKHLEEKYSDK